MYHFTLWIWISQCMTWYIQYASWKGFRSVLLPFHSVSYRFFLPWGVTICCCFSVRYVLPFPADNTPEIAAVLHLFQDACYSFWPSLKLFKSLPMSHLCSSSWLCQPWVRTAGQTVVRGTHVHGHGIIFAHYRSLFSQRFCIRFLSSFFLPFCYSVYG